MISVIICSANEQNLKMVSANISETIGVAHEIIAIDNSGSETGICEIYNTAAQKAQYEVMCFMHEDIEMITQNWGQKILGLFNENASIGLIGVAGGGYKSITPSGWYNHGIERNGGAYSNVLQGYKHAGKEEGYHYNNPKYERYSKVACVDGCWLCMRSSVWREFKFNEKDLKKFHGYDLDISLAVNQKYDVVVTFEVLLRHFSEGSFDKTWFLEMLKVHKRWSHMLPLDADQLIGDDLFQLEKWTYRRFLQDSLDVGVSKTTLLSAVWHSRRSSVIGFNVMLKLAFALLKMKPREGMQIWDDNSLLQIQ